ncbi:DotU family type VI secretion system protein [Aquabacterium sp. CECT 9606]|uniref:DotU family type VI secretion system protein n=1 Tax=Aquabacterium sp. CECT 9606 TaxID=2845822 RepID=UPI001E447627|nr:DotU family type VI secretion system protein [Aquabacterium sp. CECT 9606]CAH0351010.1 Peptidoglycan-associated lipoprotein [Aquabacterium sp. CECT 9606]
MSEEDPFAAFESDRTIIKPSAGRKPGAGAAAPAAAAPSSAPIGGLPPGAGSVTLDALMSASLNPLVSAAAPLLNAAPRIRAMAQHPNPAGLKDALADGIRKFEAQCRQRGLPNEQVIAARYVLCTLLDESAASTPWGSSGAWSAQSLLVQFHNEAWGGEKVFQLMSKLAENIETNRDLLELLYVCLAFGFEGRYKVQTDGRAQLDSVRVRLADLLRKSRGGYDKTLSPHWQGVPAQTARLSDGLPMWVVGAIVGVLLMFAFIGMRFGINSQSDATFSALQSLDVKAAPVTAPPPPVAAPAPRLAGFLKPEIEAGLVAVTDLADRSVVVIKGDGFFEPGSADIADRVKPLLVRIADGLNGVPGQVLITGHTDNQPIRSVRYPSNWHLSQERANAVKAMLETNKVKPERMRAEGRADAEPVEDNATPAGRAKNRRVEVTLFVQPAAAAQ